MEACAGWRLNRCWKMATRRGRATVKHPHGGGERTCKTPRLDVEIRGDGGRSRTEREQVDETG